MLCSIPMCPVHPYRALAHITNALLQLEVALAYLHVNRSEIFLLRPLPYDDSRFAAIAGLP